MTFTTLGGKVRHLAIGGLAAGLLLTAPAFWSRAALHAAAGQTHSTASDSGFKNDSQTVVNEQKPKHPAVIGTAELHAPTPILRYKPTDEADWRKLAAYDYRPKDSGLKLFAREGDWLHAKQGETSGWIPAWYAEKNASAIEYGQAVRLTPSPDVKLHLSPGSETSWAYDGEPLLSVLRFGEWYGVVLDSGKMTGESGSHAMLLWLKASDASLIEPLEHGVFAPDSGLSLGSIRTALDGFLHARTDGNTVRRLLGEPFSVTDARMLPPGDPDKNGIYHWKEGGQEWRYERADAHLLVRISDKGRLIGLNWILPLTDASQRNYHSWLQEPDFASLYRTLPLLPSITPDSHWRTKIDVDYAYLEYANKDTLLVRGDDGGFSGFHYSTVLYVLDRASGRVLRELNTGLGVPSFIPDSTGELLTVNGYVPQNESFKKGVIAHIQPHDNKVLWTYSWPGKASPLVYAAGDAVILLGKTTERGGMSVLVALDEKTGEKRWKQQVREPFDLLNRSSSDPYVLLAQGKTLRALDPVDGRRVWSMSSETGSIDVGESKAYDPASARPLAEADGTRWIKFDGEGWRKIDMNSGRTVASYDSPLDGLGEHIEDIGNNRLLVQKTTSKTGYYTSQMHDFESTLFDTATGSVIWTLPGKIEHGKIEADTLYAVVNGIPSALSLDSGHMIWQARINGLHPNLSFNYGYGVGWFEILGDYLLLPYNSDLIAFEKKTGRQLGRIDGFRFGYPEMHDHFVRDSLLNEQDGKLYIGSASRSFSVLDTDTLIRILDEASTNGSGVEAVTPASRASDAAAWYPAAPY